MFTNKQTQPNMEQNNTTLPEDLREQIFRESERFSFVLPYDNSLTFYDKGKQQAYTAGATAYAPWKVKHDLLQKENEALKQLFKDLHHYCNQQGIYSAVIQDMVAKALAGKGGGSNG